MTRGRKIAAIVAGSLAGLVCILVIAGIVIVQTSWFANLVRQKIVTAVEDATGGRVDIASFAFDWRHLRARIAGFVIHGLEPAGSAPLFRANLIQVDLRVSSAFISYLLVDTPQAHVLVFPDGRTNIPAPKSPAKNNGTNGVQTIVDLAIGRFDLRNGSLAFADRKSQLNASGASLRAQLAYQRVPARYSGEIDITPLFLQTGGNAPVNVDVHLPLTMERDKISLSGASLRTPQSVIMISGSMDHLTAPRTSASVNAKVSLPEVRQALGLQLDTAHAPQFLFADFRGSLDDDNIRIQAAHATLGHSEIDASGALKESGRAGSLQLRSTLATAELGSLLRLSTRPEGVIKIGATAGMNGNRIDLAGLHIDALGGSFDGRAALEDFAQFHVDGRLAHFEVSQLAHTFAPQFAAYSGQISGPLEADGNVHSSALDAKVDLAIAPGARGIPVSGRLGAAYDGRSGNIALERSRLALPHSVAEFSGSLGKQMRVHFVSRDFADLRPVAAIPFTFANGGAATVDATVTGSLSAPHVAGQATAANFTVDGRSFTRFTAAIDASPTSAAVSRAVLTRGPLQADFSGSVGLRKWKPENNQPLRVDLTVRNADLRDILALAGQSSVPATGAFRADAHIAGTVGSPAGSADLDVERGTLSGQSFDSLTAHANLTQTSVDIPNLTVVSGLARLDANARYQHAVNQLDRGNLTAHVATNQVQLAQFQSLLKDRPGLRGTLNLNADAAAAISPATAGTQFQVTSVNATASAHSLAMEGKNLGDCNLTASTAGGAVHYSVNSDFAGSTIRVEGQSLLAADHRTTAAVNIANLPIDQVLALAGRRDLPLKGTFSGNAQVAGTLQNPTGNGTLILANGTAYGEPFTRIQASVNYSDVAVEIPQLRIDDGAANVELSASFHHPAGDLKQGDLRFRARSNPIQLARIHAVSSARPGLDGVVLLAAEGAATLRGNAPIAISTLTAQLSARNVRMNRQDLGGMNLTANSRGNAVVFALNSDFAKARIEGGGTVNLAAGYPVDARLSFGNLTWAGLSPLLAMDAPIDAAVDGQVHVAGPAATPASLQGSVQLTRLEAHALASGTRPPRVKFDLRNEGTIQASLANSVVTVQNFRVNGPYANLTVAGSAALQGAQAANLRVSGNIKLDLLEAFSSDIVSSGAVTLNVAVTGKTSQPVVNGRLQLQNASFNTLSLPNGLTNANGNVNFNGTEAVVDNISGQVGGGKVTLAGFVSYGGPLTQFRLQATATQVHIDYPESITTQANARLTLAGTEARSLLSGNVTIQNVAMHSHSDIGSVLTSAATPPSAASASTGLLGGMRFDVRIRTSSGAQIRTSLTQNLQADADLALRGSPDHPGVLGRMVVNSGEVVFFGAKYTVDQGTLSFYNPNKVEPILNVDLETTVQGVDVSLTVSGPVDKLKLAYHSDPPLEFQQIVSLLASGKQPTTDPVLAAHQPPAQQQNFEQVGASTVLGQAVANPVSGRLQRLFGVSKLSIDPQIVGETSNNPQATLTLQQQVTKEITFTYIQDVSQSTPSAVRIEWAISPQFSAVAQRDVFGEFALDFFYKKRFH